MIVISCKRKIKKKKKEGKSLIVKFNVCYLLFWLEIKFELFNLCVLMRLYIS